MNTLDPRDTLIRRDAPIPKGTTIELRVTLVYEVPLDDDLLLDGQDAATLAEIDHWLGHYPSDVIRSVRDNYTAVEMEADWFLPNQMPEDYRELRFERNGERQWAKPERYIELADALPAKEAA